MRSCGVLLGLLLMGCTPDREPNEMTIVDNVEQAVVLIPRVEPKPSIHRAVLVSATTTPARRDDFVMPRTPDTCMSVDGYCVYDTGYRATEQNRFFTPLTNSEADTDGAGCTAEDNRGNVIASLVPGGPVIFRFKGKLMRLEPNDEPYDDYFAHYGKAGTEFGFRDPQQIARGVEARSYETSIEFLYDRNVYATEVRLTCGA